MDKLVSLEDLSDSIEKDFILYTKELAKEFDEVAREIAKETVKELEKETPLGDRKQFAKGWKTSVTKLSSGAIVTISNKEYQLTHLINDGHKMRQGGRAKAFRLITRNEIKAKQKFMKKVEDILDKY